MPGCHACLWVLQTRCLRFLWVGAAHIYGFWVGTDSALGASRYRLRYHIWVVYSCLLFWNEQIAGACHTDYKQQLGLYIYIYFLYSYIYGFFKHIVLLLTIQVFLDAWIGFLSYGL